MKNWNPQIKPLVVALIAVTALQGCGITQVRENQAAIVSDAQAKLDGAPRSRPVVRIHDGSWLMGEKIRASKPQPEIFSKQVVFKGSLASLTEAADWIAQNVGVRATVEASAATIPLQMARSGSGNAPQRMSDLNGPLPSSYGTGAAPLSPTGAAISAGTTASAAVAPLVLSYTGNLRGFLETVDAHWGVWDRYRDGTVAFFKTETRTFPLPDLGEVASMNGSISANSTGAAGSGSSGTSTASTGTGSSSGSGNGGQTATLAVVSDPWLNLEKIAKTIAGADATVVADKHLGSVTVTATPPQCDRLEEWVKGLDAMFGKQIGIDVKIYEVRLSQEDNYGLNLSLAYKSGNGHTGATFTGAGVPSVTSTASPMTFGATIVGGKLDGTKAALQALSTLGNVSRVLQRGGVTQNGKVLALQDATLQDFVQGTQTTLASNVGSTTAIQTSTNISGFTGNFRPKVINGRIMMVFDMTISELQPLQTFTSGSSASQSTVQLRTMPLARFEQSVGLRPGETLVLTGMREQSTSTTNNGIGSPYMPLLGGGVDAQKKDTMIAVVITARLL